MSNKRWCAFAKKLCKHCSENEILCNEIEREGISYLDCRFATTPNGVFKVIITCGVCGDNDVNNENNYVCNVCGNKS